MQPRDSKVCEVLRIYHRKGRSLYDSTGFYKELWAFSYKKWDLHCFRKKKASYVHRNVLVHMYCNALMLRLYERKPPLYTKTTLRYSQVFLYTEVTFFILLRLRLLTQRLRLRYHAQKLGAQISQCWGNMLTKISGSCSFCLAMNSYEWSKCIICTIFNAWACLYGCIEKNEIRIVGYDFNLVFEFFPSECLGVHVISSVKLSVRIIMYVESSGFYLGTLQWNIS